MTALDDRPRNGTPVPAAPTQPLDQHDHEPTSPPTAESQRVTDLRDRLQDRTAERDISQQLRDVESDPVFEDLPSESERGADRGVREEIRTLERKERLRSGKAAVRRQRWARFQARLDERAERTREKILDPARTLGADYRRWIATSAILFALLAGGALYMSHTVKLGLVGAGGTPLAYLAEPLASLVLVLSMIAQYTARQRDIPVPRGFLVLDGTLGLASLLLMTVPWGMRYGWNLGDLLGHLLLPALMVIGITAWHMASGIYSQTIANSKHDPVLRDRLALLREAVRVGELPTDVSPNQVIKYLRNNLPTGIGHDAARRIARNFLGY